MKFAIKLLLFSLISISKLQAQHIVNVPNIDVIAYNHESFMLYEKINETTFKEIDVYINTKGKQFNTVDIDRSGYNYSLEQVKRDDKNLIWIDQLPVNGFERLQHTEWELKSPETEEGEHLIFKFSDQNFVGFYELEALETEHVTQSQWDIIDLIWYQPIVLDFGNGKQILLFSDGSYDIDYTIIPTTVAPIVLSEDFILDEAVPIEKGAYFINAYDEFHDFDFDAMYQNVKDGKTFRLYDYFGNDLLGVRYDTIIHNSYFIIGQKNDRYDIYTSLLRKLEVPKFTKVYLQNDQLEILTPKGPAYYDYFGRNPATKYIRTLVPGRDNATQFELIYATDAKHKHRIKISHKSTGKNNHTTKELVFTNISNKSQIRFLDNTTHKYWNENKGKQTKYPEYLKVKTKNAYGLFSYPYNLQSGTNGTQKEVSDKTPLKISATKELPVKFDEITIYDSLILFYKNNKVGIFPHHKKPQYELFEKGTSSFYKIVKNGRTGWLDINTMEEYFFD